MLNIREETLGPHFHKYHIDLGDNNYLQLHRFTEPDVVAPHDHPWDFSSLVVKGSYIEEVFLPVYFDGEKIHEWERVINHRNKGSFELVPANRIHRIIALPDGECWTACLYGPNIQKVKFYPEALEYVRSR